MCAAMREDAHMQLLPRVTTRKHAPACSIVHKKQTLRIRREYRWGIKQQSMHTRFSWNRSETRGSCCESPRMVESCQRRHYPDLVEGVISAPRMEHPCF